MKLDDMMTFLQKTYSRNVSIVPQRCVNVRNRNVGCHKCFEACVSGCLSLDETQILMDAEKCIGCGTCASACPSGALEPMDPSDAEVINEAIVAAQRNDGKVVILCDKMAERVKDQVDIDKVIPLQCIGRLNEGLLCEMFARGVKDVIIINSLCGECDYSNSNVRVAEVVRNTETLLDVWEKEHSIRFKTKLPASTLKEDLGYDQRKRAMFMSLKNEGFAAADEALSIAMKSAINENIGEELYQSVNKNGIIPHALSVKRQRLLNALNVLGTPRDEMIDAGVFGHPVLDENKCSSCYMCTTFCPSGALSRIIDDSGNTTGITVTPGLCTKCKTCESICLQGAIDVSDEVFARDILAGSVEEHHLEEQERDLTKKYSFTSRFQI